MSTMSLILNRPSLIDRIVTRSAAGDAVLIASGAALTAVAAQVAIPLWPVPITMQTLAVLLVGSTLGAVRGALSMTIYLVVGMLGAPVFSDASSGASVVFGPTGGYIIGFVFAAGLTGWLAQRNWDKKFLGAAVSFLSGTVVTFAFGLVWLAVVLSANLQQALEWGLYPFIVGGIVKAAVAAAIIPSAWRLVARIDKKRD